MNDELTPLLKFTPSANDPAVLETITVQREPLIARLVDAALDRDAGARHQLLVGPRGIGKTHIMSLVASRVVSAEREDILVAWLDEDHYGLGGYGRLIATILARVAEVDNDTELAEAAATLRRSAADNTKVEELLREAVGDRRLVLLVENLDVAFRRIGKDGEARLRAFAEDWRDLMIVATTQQLFEGIQRQTSPFYGFFAVQHLDELTIDNAIELLQRVATLRTDTQLAEFLSTDVARSRVAAVQALAGGHPRIWLLLAVCVSVEAIEKLVPVFLEALDELTPYYQERLNMLGDQQQELVILLAEAGGALSNRELAERSGIPPNQVATLLSKLAAHAYVRRAELPKRLGTGDKRMSFWELREPLMRLCLDVKQARGKPLRIIVEFLRAWYGIRLLDELLRLPESAQLATTYAAEALRALGNQINPDDLLAGSPSEVIARADLGLELLPENWELQAARGTGLLMEGRHAEALEAYRHLLSQEPKGTLSQVGIRLQVVACQRALNQSVDLEGLMADAQTLHSRNPDDSNARALLGLAYHEAGQPQQALSVWQNLPDSHPAMPFVSIHIADTLNSLGRHEEAAEAYARALGLNPGRCHLLTSQGRMLLKLNRYMDALSAFESALRLDSEDLQANIWLAYTLSRLKRHTEAFAAFDKLLERAPNTAPLYGLYGLLLQLAGRDREALAAYTRTIDLDPSDPKPHLARANLLTGLDEPEAAVAAYEQAVALGMETATIYCSLAGNLREIDRLDDAEHAAMRAIDMNPSWHLPRFTLVEISLAQRKPERALELLRDALPMWSESGATDGPGDPDLLCRLLWESRNTDPGWKETVATAEALYRKFEGLDGLGTGLVKTIPLLVEDNVSQSDAEAWLASWSVEPAPELEIPLRMVRAAVAWKRDRDRAHLLALPTEQRQILIGLLDVDS